MVESTWDLDAHPNKTNLVGLVVAAAQHCSFRRKTRSTKPEPMVRMSATLYQINNFYEPQRYCNRYDHVRDAHMGVDKQEYLTFVLKQRN